MGESAHDVRRVELVQGSGAHDVRVRLVQGFDAEDIKQYLLHRQNFYDSDEDLRRDFDNSDEDHSEDNAYDSEEYYGMHSDK